MVSFILCICACILSFVMSVLLYRPSHTPIFQNMSSRGGIAVVLSFALCGSALCLVMPDRYEFLPIMLFATGLGLHGITTHRLNRFWTYLTVCALSVCLMPTRFLFFHGSLPLFADRAVTAILWAFSLHMSASLNAVPRLMTSVIKLNLWMLMFLNVFVFKIPSFAWAATICLMAQAGFSLYANKKPFLRQGKSGIVPAMYVIGFFWLWMSAALQTQNNSMWAAILVAYTPMIFEIVYSFIYRWIFRKKQEPKMLSFFYVQILQKYLDKSALITRFFDLRWTLLLLLASVISVLDLPFTKLIGGVALVLFVLGLDMFTQLKLFHSQNLSLTTSFSSIPACKEIAAGCKELASNCKKFIDNILHNNKQ